MVSGRCLQVCLKDVSGKFYGCFTEASSVFQESFKDVSKKYQGCFKKVSRVFHMYGQ